MVSPDMGGIRRIKGSFRNVREYSLSFATVVKNRDLASGRVLRYGIERVMFGEKQPIIVDDMVSTGITMVARGKFARAKTEQ